MNRSGNDQLGWHPAVLYERVGDVLRCDLCPHRCELSEGQTGRCNVRRRSDGAMQTATFATAVRHVAPIERKPFYHFRPGRSAMTLAAPGCSLFCSYCVNFRISQYGRPAAQAWSGEPVDVEEVVAAAAAAGTVLAQSFTEPSLAIELALALAQAGRDRGVELVWKSNGFLTGRATDLVAPVLAAANIDIKAADDDRHRALTGGALAPVLDTVRRLWRHGVWVEVSTPLIPGVSDAPADLERIASMIADIDVDMPWHLLRFTPTFRMSAHVPTPPERLAAAVGIGRSAGLRYVYVERALGEAGRRTDCPSCGATVVTRGVWRTETNRLTGGACPSCATPVAGRW